MLQVANPHFNQPPEERNQSWYEQAVTSFTNPCPNQLRLLTRMGSLKARIIKDRFWEPSWIIKHKFRCFLVVCAAACIYKNWKLRSFVQNNHLQLWSFATMAQHLTPHLSSTLT